MAWEGGRGEFHFRLSYLPHLRSIFYFICRFPKKKKRHFYMGYFKPIKFVIVAHQSEVRCEGRGGKKDLSLWARYGFFQILINSSLSCKDV